ncbi:MAG: UvrD-helicase domain-containing protein, partial [Pseudomonadota bacterium]
MNHLNPPQREAVRYLSGPLLVLAGAGSGKTSVITQKIAHLINECGYQSKHITAVTFTNKAAREMKSRVTELLGNDKAKSLRVSTFHHLGLSIIRKELKTLGLKNGFSIFDSSDSYILIKELLMLDDIDKDMVEFFQNQISWLKNQLISPEDSVQQAQSKQEQRLARVYLRYVEALKAYNAVDFDDLIYIPVKLFDAHREVLLQWQHKIRYLLVDEYQDTNTCQYHLIKQLTGVSGMLTA